MSKHLSVVFSSALQPIWILCIAMAVSLSACRKDSQQIPVPVVVTQPDPLYQDQWYLNGNGGRQTIYLTQNQYTGKGVLIALVDNGIDINHEDLKENIVPGSYSYLPVEYDFAEADHGTACAGIIVAKAGNGKGIRGIAPDAKMVAFNAQRTPEIGFLADALQRNKEKIWISSNSWGDFNSWGEPMPLRPAIQEALEKGTTYGRNGRGIVYVFSSGNGNTANGANLPTDNVNYSGLVNNRYTIPVGAVDEKGKHASYSEVGATLLVCAPSKANGGMGIVTTDATGRKGYNPLVFQGDYADSSHNYTKHFSGTSASAPMVTGVVALILEANPSLSWRDVKAILAYSASMCDVRDSDWFQNGAGLWVNHQYGFGIVNADRAILMSKGWHPFSTEKIVSKEQSVDRDIPDNDVQGLTSQLVLDENVDVEFIDVYVDAPTHTRLGDLEIVLISPQGTTSILAEYHTELFSGAFRYHNWRFGTMRCLGEKSKGVWKLTIKDKKQGAIGALRSWKVIAYGH